MDLLNPALNMSGIPFRSRLEPFYEMIVQSRRARMTWEKIAQTIGDKTVYGDKAVPCTRQAVQDYFKRRRGKKIRVPMGMEPDPPQPAVQREMVSVQTQATGQDAYEKGVDERSKIPQPKLKPFND